MNDQSTVLLITAVWVLLFLAALCTLVYWTAWLHGFRAGKKTYESKGTQTSFIDDPR